MDTENTVVIAKPTARQLVAFVRENNLTFDLQTEEGVNQAYEAYHSAHSEQKKNAPTKNRTVGLLVKKGDDWVLFNTRTFLVTRGLGASKSQEEVINFLETAAIAAGHEETRAIMIEEIER